MPFAARFAICFVIAVVVDAFWALYLRRAGEGHAAKTAHYATLLMALGMYNTDSWLHDKRLIPAVLVGGWIGTYFTVRHDAKKPAAVAS